MHMRTYQKLWAALSSAMPKSASAFFDGILAKYIAPIGIQPSTDYARLLDAARQQLGAPVVLVWDNLNTHVSRAMGELIAARDWLTVFQLPAYASELNPVESVWSHLKRSLANLAKRDIAQLTALAKTRLRRMQYPPGLIEGFLAGTGSTSHPSVTPAIEVR